MRLQITSLCAVLALLAACSSSPVDQSATTGAGGQTAASAVPGSVEDFTQNVGDKVYFAFDKSDVQPEAEVVLQRQAEWLKKYPAMTVVIEGHCDERGTREYNLALGERRASAVKNHLVALGIETNRVEVISYGKDKPFVSGSSEESWAQNRVGLTVLK